MPVLVESLALEERDLAKLAQDVRLVVPPMDNVAVAMLVSNSVERLVVLAGLENSGQVEYQVVKIALVVRFVVAPLEHVRVVWLAIS